MSVERLDQTSTQDRLQVALHRARYDFALKEVAGATSILEIGTGCGELAEDLAKLPAKYAGVEIDADAAAQTRTRVGSAGEIVEVDARNLPFPDDTFSHVICLEVLEHLGDYRPAISQMKRCLQPNGKAVISVPYRKTGGTNPGNRFHLYEPGEFELVAAFKEEFLRVDTLYQSYEESWFMTVSRRLRIRRFVGLTEPYRLLSLGDPSQLKRLRIGPERTGMVINLILMAENPKK